MTTGSASSAPSASDRRRRGAARALLLLGTALVPAALWAQELPTGGSVAHGTVDIARPGAGAMTITQGSANAVVNWDGFSIGQGGSVDIRQPGAESALLNRVTGSATSQIHGRLTANGQVYLVNPNGIFIGKDGTVNAGGFVASTLGIRDEDFILGKPVFEGGGNSAAVANDGTIDIVPGGYAALLGGKVSNAGTIRVPLGKVGLGAGERVTLDFGGDGFLQVAVPSDGGDAGMDALIDNSGTIEANGGQVHMSAATARNAVRNAINLSGVVEARSVSGRNGNITLGGGSGGRVKVTGRVDASSPSTVTAISLRPNARPETGGSVTVTGRDIALKGAAIDARGPQGGGTIRIGGEQAGGPGLPTATTLTVDAGTAINADALVAGDGGRIILWSDLTTTFAGNISARGGAEGGNGGFAEVSGKQALRYSGRADMRAPNGAWGTLLLDPTDIQIVAGPIVDPDDLLASDVIAQLGLGNVLVSTGSSELEPGDITVQAALTWSAATDLTLSADNNIVLNAPITAPNGSLTLASFGTSITTSAAGTVDVGAFTLSLGDWVQLSDPLPAFSADDFTVFSSSSFLRALSGDGSGTPYRIADVYGLQGIASGFLSADNFELANDIDASGTASWNSDFFGPRGFTQISELTGRLDGRRYAIDGLFTREGGLIANIGDLGEVRELRLTNADVEGTLPGVLAGINNGTIAGVGVSGSVISYDGDAGGLVAVNNGIIADSYSAVDLTLGIEPGQEGRNPNDVSIGGLVGINGAGGSITRSDSDSIIDFFDSFTAYVGGLVGANEGAITDSFSTSDVTADFVDVLVIGGLVGGNSGTITRSHAAGLVNPPAFCCEIQSEGGLVGENNIFMEPGTVTASFWDTEASGQAASDGGTGLTTAQMQDTEGFIALAEPLGWNFDTTWAPGAPGFYPVNYTTTAVIFARPDDTTFVYNGTATDFTPTGTFSGGVDDFLFGPLNDALVREALNDDVLADGPDTGTRRFSYQTTALTSDQGVDFRIVALDAQAVITPAPLEIIADDQSKVYGDAILFDGTEFTAVGLFADDTVDSATIASTGADETATVAGSPYDIEISGAQGFGLTNYDISYTFGSLVVNPAPLTLIIGDQTKVYGERFTFSGTEFQTSGLLFDDTVDSLTLASDGAGEAAGVAGSPYAITGSDPTGFGVGNYAITYVPGAMTVTPAPLTVAALDQTKVYGQGFTFAGTEFTVDGLLNGDSVDSATLTSDGALPSIPVGDGSYDIFISDALGSGLDNYAISYVPGLMFVTRAPLTVTALDQIKLFGDTFVFDGSEFTVAGLVNDDTVDNAVLFSDGADADAPIAGSPYAIQISTVNGSGLENYELALVDGEMAVINGQRQQINPLPPFVGLLPNPNDVISIPGLEEGLQVALSGPGTVQKAAETLASVDQSSTEMEIAIKSCGGSDQDISTYMTCLAAALDTYADALDTIAADLPSGLENVSAIIREARAGIRAAGSRAERRLATATTDAERQAIRRDAIDEARASIDTAKSEIRKAITLIRAEDPELVRVQRATVTRIVDAFDTVDTQLVSAVEL